MLTRLTPPATPIMTLHPIGSSIFRAGECVINVNAWQRVCFMVGTFVPRLTVRDVQTLAISFTTCNGYEHLFTSIKLSWNVCFISFAMKFWYNCEWLQDFTATCLLSGLMRWKSKGQLFDLFECIQWAQTYKNSKGQLYIFSISHGSVQRPTTNLIWPAHFPYHNDWSRRSTYAL